MLFLVLVADCFVLVFNRFLFFRFSLVSVFSIFSFLFSLTKITLLSTSVLFYVNILPFAIITFMRFLNGRTKSVTEYAVSLSVSECHLSVTSRLCTASTYPRPSLQCATEIINLID